MSRSSDLIDYDRRDSIVLYEDKDVIRVRRHDGTKAIGAKSYAGMDRLHSYTTTQPYCNWRVWKLPDGSIYLIEEVVNGNPQEEES